MNDDDELRVLRARVAAIEDELARLGPGALPSGLARVVKTISLGSYPTGSTALKTYAVRGLDVTGVESEGSTAVTSEDTRHFFAVNLGTSVPPVGTQLIAVSVPNRWVFRYP